MPSVTKYFKVQRCARIPANENGRDLVVGDLHGHRDLLERVLDELSFDPLRDRVLSVGDLIDRGPDSFATLSLLDEPWFHAVLGNHELMLLNFLGYYGSRLHSRKSYACGAGEWINDAMSRYPKALARLADRVAALPLAMHVEGDVPFNVMHGDLHPIGSRQDVLARDRTICVHKADAATTSRANFCAALKSELLELSFAQQPVNVSSSPIGELPITYVGHSRIRQIIVHDSYVYIDQGVCAPTPKRGRSTPPTVLNHRRFAHWLNGVASARDQTCTDRPLLALTDLDSRSVRSPIHTTARELTGKNP